MKVNNYIEIGVFTIGFAITLKLSLLVGPVIALTVGGFLLVGYGFLMNTFFDQS
jgi:hypothetical protein